MAWAADWGPGGVGRGVSVTSMAHHRRAPVRHLPVVLVGSTVLALTLASCSTSTSAPETTTAATSGSPTAAALPRATSDSLQQVLISTQDALGFAGALAGVWTPDGEWTGVVGTVGAGQSDPPTAADHTRIGSITKTYTVTALLQEVEKGTLALSDKIEQYVPGLPNGEKATLRDLAQMTSGIPSYTMDEEWLTSYFNDTSQTFTAQQLVDYVKGDKPMFRPGQKFFYSNTNTVALGMAIEKATGRPVGDVITEQIIEPLGLSGTSWPGESPDLPEPYLSGQTEQGLPEGTVKDATNWNPSWANAAGEMISTLPDLRTWGVALGTGEGILKSETQQLRLDSLNENVSIKGNSRDTVYGIGVGRIDGWVGHTGELPGYNTSVQYDPKTQTTVAVMVNSDIQNPAVTIMEQLQQVLAE